MRTKLIANQIFEILQAQASSFHQPFLLAIDGRCASGKTTIAAQLETMLPCSVFHMDDFFLPVEKRSSMPGGNIDYERICKEILQPCKSGCASIGFHPFDCHTQNFLQIRKKDIKPFVIVEGSYSCHPLLFDYFHLHIFLTVDESEQKNRIISRNGEKGWIMFREKWIPLEEEYFSKYDILQKCAYCFQT